MPEAFESCRKRGGKIRTIKLSGGKYRKACYIGGKVYYGHVKTKKKGK